MKKGCELCNLPARMYCESDKARLCWECDEKIHSANFLVAKHSRSPICHLCQSPTPWTAAGPKLPPTTVSVCHSCLLNNNNNNNAPNSSQNPSAKELSSDSNSNTSREGDTDDVAADTEEEDDNEEEEDGENQVVPLHSTSNINEEEEEDEVSSSSSSRFSAGSVSTSKRFHDTNPSVTNQGRLVEEDAQLIRPLKVQRRSY